MFLVIITKPRGKTGAPPGTLKQFVNFTGLCLQNLHTWVMIEETKRKKGCHGRTETKKRLYLRHGWCDLSRQPSAARRKGICGLAVRGEKTLSVFDQFLRAFPEGASAEARAHGAGGGREPLLYQRAGDRAFHPLSGARLQRLCCRRRRTDHGPARRGHHDERREPRICSGGRGT